jgi:hypothetical protein
MRDPFKYQSRISGSNLVTTIGVDDKELEAYSIDLNRCLGLTDGKLDRTKKDLFKDPSVHDQKIDTGTNTLSVMIMDKYDQPHNAKFNLDLILYVREKKYWCIEEYGLPPPSPSLSILYFTLLNTSCVPLI